MRRAFGVSLVAGAALAFACSTGNDDETSSRVAPTSRGPVSSSGSSGAIVEIQPDDTVTPRITCAGPEHVACGAGCCAPGYLCLLDQCVGPGVTCEADSDCTEERYCEPLLGRCLPRPELCAEDDPKAPYASTCLEGDCPPEKSSLVILRTVRTPCDCSDDPVPTIGVRVQNRGRKTVAAGVKVRFWRADVDAGDAGENVAEGETLEPLIPGQSTDVYAPWRSCSWYMDIVREPDDCRFGAVVNLSGAGCSSSGSGGGE